MGSPPSRSSAEGSGAVIDIDWVLSRSEKAFARTCTSGIHHVITVYQREPSSLAVRVLLFSSVPMSSLDWLKAVRSGGLRFTCAIALPIT